MVQKPASEHPCEIDFRGISSVRDSKKTYFIPYLFGLKSTRFKDIQTMRIGLLTGFFLLTFSSFSQNVLEWNPNYQILLTDFQSKETQIGDGAMYGVQGATRIDFSFFMTNAEFMTTKNWNPKVKCTFTRDASYILAPNDTIAQALVNYARYEFDLAELHARKLRHGFWENKKAFSSLSFFQPVYDDVLKEFTETQIRVAKETDLGRNAAVLQFHHDEVLVELATLKDFCKSCKPPKKKK